MKTFYSLLFLIALPLIAELPVPVSTEIVTPGVIHNQYTLPGPFTLDVLEIDTKNPYLSFESYRPDGLTKTTVQSAANDAPGHRVIGAVNAGFFSFETGWPVHNQAVNGVPVLGISSIKSSFVFTDDRKIYLDGFSFAGTLFDKNGSALALNGSNTTRTSNQTVLFTPFKGSATGTDGSGEEISFTFLSSTQSLNDTLLVVASQKGSGNISIPANGVVVSGSSGSPASFLTNNISVGDTVKLYLAYNPRTPSAIKGITQLITGNGRIIKDGVPYPAIGDYDQSGQSFNDARHPRTFVGINADTSKVYFCTVDGRQASSLGMSFTEMANFLISLDVTNALNFDGGGSTTMVVRGNVVNSPSDPGGERSVANTLQVISTAPLGTLNMLNILENQKDIFQGNSFQFHAVGKDEFYNPLDLPAGIVWECDTSVGTIDQTGLFTAKNTNDSGWVRIKYNAISDSARLYVRVIKALRLYPSSLVMTPGEQVTLTIYGIDSGNNVVPIQGNQVVPLVSGQGINFSPADKVVSATGFANGTLQLSLDTVKISLPYNFHGGDTTVTAEQFSDQFLWKQDVTGTDPDNVAFSFDTGTVFSAPNSLRLYYNFPSVDAPTAFVKTDLPLASRPDSIYIKVYGDGGGHTLKLIFADKNGEQFYCTSSTVVSWNGAWQNVGFKMVNAKPVSSGTLDYPITLKEIQIQIGKINLSSGRAAGKIFLDDIFVHYPNRAVAPQVLYDFNGLMAGWQTFQASSVSQLKGINIAASNYQLSAEHPYEGTGCGKWTIVDDAASSVNWDVRITRTTSAELGSMLRGSYIGAWIWANGDTKITLRTVIRDGSGQICAGPAFPVKHTGWKLIGTKLDPPLFSPYLTAGTITDAGNKFNGFNVLGNNSDLNGQTAVFFVDKMVTSALTVPSGFIDFGAVWDSLGNQVKISWGVNSEISINRYAVERSSGGSDFVEIGSVAAKGNTDTTARYSYYDNIGNLALAQYRIRQITNDGGQESTPVINFILTGVNGDHFSPMTFELRQNFPNPFNPATTIQFQIPNSALTTLRVYDILGREISTILNQDLNAGVHKINWDSAHVASGVYFYRLASGKYVDTKKMIVAK